MINIRKLSVFFVALGLLAEASSSCGAEAYPSRAVRIVVAYAAGGGNDLVARILAKHLSEKYDRTFLVDNRPGASGILGTELVARSTPDGYTLILSDAPHVTNPYVYPNVQYDPIKDFSPVVKVGSAPVALTIYPKAPFQTLTEFVAQAKSQPGRITMGSGGTGTVSHFAGELFQLRTGIKLIHVPYKGNGPALADVVSGQILCIFTPVAAALPLVSTGRMRVLAISSAKRSPAVPDAPTFEEAGIADYRVANWYGILSPAGTPKAVVAQLNKEILAGLQTPYVKERFETSMIDPGSGSPEQFTEFMKAEVKRWSTLIKTVGIKVE